MQLELSQKKSLTLLAAFLGDSQEDSLFLLIIKKISFLAKADKIFIFCYVPFRGSKRGVIIKIDFWGFNLWGFRGGGTQKFPETKPCF